MAQRIVRREKRQRGFFGWIFLLIFIGWNLLMAYAFFGGLANVGSGPAPVTSAERAGQAIGVTLGVGIILGIWSSGAIITGLLAFLTRGPKIIIEDEPPRRAVEPEPPLIEARARTDRREPKPLPPPSSAEPEVFVWRFDQGKRLGYTLEQFGRYHSAVQGQLTTWDASVSKLERTAWRAIENNQPLAADHIAAIDQLFDALDRGVASYRAFRRSLTFARVEDAQDRSYDLSDEFASLTSRLAAIPGGLAATSHEDTT